MLKDQRLTAPLSMQRVRRLRACEYGAERWRRSFGRMDEHAHLTDGARLSPFFGRGFRSQIPESRDRCAADLRDRLCPDARLFAESTCASNVREQRHIARTGVAHEVATWRDA